MTFFGSFAPEQGLCSTEEAFKAEQCCSLPSSGELHIESRCWECGDSDKKGASSVEERDSRN